MLMTRQLCLTLKNTRSCYLTMLDTTGYKVGVSLNYSPLCFTKHFTHLPIDNFAVTV